MRSVSVRIRVSEEGCVSFWVNVKRWEKRMSMIVLFLLIYISFLWPQKLTAFQRPSPNVTHRSSRHDEKKKRRDTSSNKSDKLDDDKIKAALERKAKVYDQLQRGKTGGLSEEKFQDSLIDWDRNWPRNCGHGDYDRVQGVRSKIVEILLQWEKRSDPRRRLMRGFVLVPEATISVKEAIGDSPFPRSTGEYWKNIGWRSVVVPTAGLGGSNLSLNVVRGW